MTLVVTGIQPSGTPHLGNYFGMIAPALAMADGGQAMYFIADYHALTTVRDPDRLAEATLDVAATWLALGLDPDRVVLSERVERAAALIKICKEKLHGTELRVNKVVEELAAEDEDTDE